MGVRQKFFSMTRKPEGFLGKLMLRSMNSGHAKMADWGMGRLPKLLPERVADLGCGGGRNLAVLLKKYGAAKVTGVDYSPASVERAVATNRRAVDVGRCRVLEGNVSRLDELLEEGQYDLATAFETVYFWPGLEQCFRQVNKILKPGGLFLIVNEADGEDETGLKWEKIVEGMKIYTPFEMRQALQAAGFTWVETGHHETKPWVAVLARK